jgi:membrane-associated protease RseP (regulator of RpoE activity)
LNKPAAVAGVLPGDTILAVNGKKVRDFGEIIQYVALSAGGEDILLTIQRPGIERPFDLAIRPSTKGRITGVRQIGITGPLTFKVGYAGDYKGVQGLEEGEKGNH